MNHLTNVKPSEDPTAGVSVTGPGIIGDKAKKKTNFVIRGDIPDWAPLDVNITAPDGDKVSFEEMQYAANSTAIHYTPPISGKYTIEVLVNRHHIKGSPFTAHHAEPSTALGCVCKGCGVMKAVVGEKGHFTIDCSNGGTGRLQIGIRGPTSNISSEISQTSDKVYEVNYTPTEAGPHKITALWGRNHIDKSPFTVNVIDPKKCIAHGAGLTEAIVNEPASFRVETKNAGQGTLIVKVTGQNSNSIPVTIHKGSQDDYTCSYIPPKEGLYSIEIFWGDQQITCAYKVVATVPVDALTIPTHEPVDQVLISDVEASNATKCIITGLEKLSVSPMINIPLEFGVDATDGGNGELHVTTDHPSGKDSSIVTVKEIEGQKGIYRITYIPTSTGEHIVDLLWGEEYIPGSPLVFNVVSSSSEHVYPYGKPIAECNATKCIITGLERLSVSPMINIPLEFGVDATDGGNGELHVTTDHPSGKDSSIVTVKEIEGQKGIYRITYIPTSTGEHIVDLLWGEEYIPGSPLMFNVVSSSSEHVYPYGKPIAECNATKCIITGLERLSVSPMINIPLEFGVDATNGGNGELHVTTDHPSGKDSSIVTVKEIEGQKGIYHITYIPTNTREHIVDLLWGEEYIPGSPLVFNVVSSSSEHEYPYGKPIAECNATKCIITGLERLSVSPMINIPLEFGVDATNGGNGELHVTTDHPSGKDSSIVTVKEIEGQKGIYHITYIPTTTGEHIVDLLWGEEYIPGSPLVFNVVSSSSEHVYPYGKPIAECNATKCIITGLEKLSVSPMISIPLEFGVDATDGGRGELHVTTDHPSRKDSSIVTVKEIEGQKGIYRITYIPTSTGEHIVDLLWGEEYIPGSPLVFNVVSSSAITGEHLYQDGKPIEDDYQLSMFFNDQAVPRSPLFIPIKPIFEPVDQVILTDVESGFGLEAFQDETLASPDEMYLYIGEPFTIDFDAPLTNDDSLDEEQQMGLSVTAIGDKNGPAEVKITRKDKAQYKIVFNPLKPDRYVINVDYNGSPAPGSPIIVHYSLPVDATKCVITGLERLSDSPMIDIPLEFGVDATNGGNGELHVTTDHPSGKDSSIVTVKEIEGQKGIYHITYIPTSTGEHIVDLLWGEEYIPGSPLVFNVVSSSSEHEYPYGKPIAECNATKCVITGLEKLSVSPMISIPLEFGVDATNGGRGELHVTTDQPYSSAVTIDEIEGQKGVYRIMYVPKAPGKHIVNLQWGKECIPGSPLVFDVVSSSAITGESVYPYGKPVVLQLSAECKTKDLDVYAIHKRTNAYTKLKVSKARKDHFILSFKPKKSGFYDTHVKLKGEYVAGSPYRVQYADPPDASKVTVSIVPSDIAYVHTPINFTINVKQAGIGNLVIKANVRKLPKGKRSSPEFKLVDNEDGTFLAQFVPIYDLVHNFDVLFAGVPVPGSPFSVQVIEKPIDTPKCNVRAYGSGLEDGYVGQEGNFIIETDKAGTGSLNVRVHGPKGSFQINMRRHPKNDHKIFVRYDPKYAGKYTIEVTWSGVHITGSPFIVNIR